MYHRVSPRREWRGIRGLERNYTLPAEELERQIVWLKQNGYRFLTAEEAQRVASRELELDQPGVALTFDDGCVSVFESALPVLRRHGVCATAFITTDPASYIFGSGQRRMSDEELRGLQAAGICCESHGMTHRPLVQLSDDEVRAELSGAKAELERAVGHEIKFLSAPGNWIDRRVAQIASQEGYQSIWTSRPGVVRPGSNVLGLPRLSVDGAMTLDGFAAMLTPWGVAQRYWVYAAKSFPKRILGPRVWYACRSRFLPWLPGGFLSFARWRMIVTLPVIFLALMVLFKAFNG
jgi:peptidoglycan/xylan/chitin deacetylase (PgdA/CDA1 family)